ncbi:MAG: hypothetical protein QOC61_1956 [Acidobacteriota bacterium]|nr:hypothetical protein [Acidobacteriota bacterium]
MCAPRSLTHVRFTSSAGKVQARSDMKVSRDERLDLQSTTTRADHANTCTHALDARLTTHTRTPEFAVDEYEAFRV